MNAWKKIYMLTHKATADHAGKQASELTRAIAAHMADIETGILGIAACSRMAEEMAEGCHSYTRDEDLRAAIYAINSVVTRAASYCGDVCGKINEITDEAERRDHSRGDGHE